VVALFRRVLLHGPGALRQAQGEAPRRFPTPAYPPRQTAPLLSITQGPESPFMYIIDGL
jgi:hypothetical protein